MARESLIQFIEEYGRRGKEIAIAHRRGYRMERWSYARVAGAARNFAGMLRDRGVNRGEHVLLWGENCAEWVAAFFGCVLAGVIVVPMDYAADASFAARVAQTVSAKLIIHSRGIDTSRIGLPGVLLEEIGQMQSLEAGAHLEAVAAKRS